MITIMKGDILKSECRTIANPISCDGNANNGLAAELKGLYPEMFKQYTSYCKDNLLDIGKLWLYKGKENDNWVLNFPIKKTNRCKPKLAFIEEGLDKLISTYEERKIGSIALPLLGADKLDRKDVLALMIDKLVKCDNLYVEIWV